MERRKLSNILLLYFAINYNASADIVGLFAPLSKVYSIR